MPDGLSLDVRLADATEAVSRLRAGRGQAIFDGCKDVVLAKINKELAVAETELDALTDAQVAAHQAEVQADAERDKDRRKKLNRAANKARAERMRLVEQCESTTNTLVETMRRVVALGGEEAKLRSELGETPIALSPPAIRRRLGRYLSAALRRIEGPNAPRFGEIVLCPNVRPAPSWVEGETKAPSNGNDYATEN